MIKPVKKKVILGSITAVVLIAALYFSQTYIQESRNQFTGEHFSCMIEFLPGNDSITGLLVGYNYHLLKKMAEEKDASFDIVFADRSESCVDSLKNGNIDIAVIPYFDMAEIDSVLTSIPIDGLSYWVVSQENKKMLNEINEWIEQYHNSEEYKSTKELYMDIYNPFRRARSGKTYNHISPYDNLFKKYADTVGCDWRLLAAIAYQESHFRIEAISRRGAYGLMQMMPHTAKKYNAANLLDPEQSVAAGAAYLKTLFKRYSKVAANNTERAKFALAAYNAGEGRIKNFMIMADTLNVDKSHWESVSSLFDQVESFKGIETRCYVDSVMDLYDAMVRICPED